MIAPDAAPRGPTPSDYASAVARFLAAIDRMLAAGHAAERRYEIFCAQHGIAAGSGEAALLADHLSPAQRHLHAGLLELRRRLYQEHLPATSVARAPSSESAPATTVPRSLGRHARI